MENKKIYNVRTAEALEITKDFGITSEKTLKRYREKGLLSADTRPDTENKNRETVFYNREELEALGKPKTSSYHPALVATTQTQSLQAQSMQMPDLLTAFSSVIQQTQSVNEKVLTLAEAVRESGLKKSVIKDAIDNGLIIARKGKAQKKVLNGKEFTSYPLQISKVSLLQFTYNYLREPETIQFNTAKA